MPPGDRDPNQKNQGPEQNRDGGGHKQDGGGLPPEKSMTPKPQDPKRDDRQANKQ